MRITTRTRRLGPFALRQSIHAASRTYWEGGIRPEAEYVGAIPTDEDTRARINLRLRAGSYSKAGRLSQSGRSSPWACFHAHATGIAVVFGLDPQAEVRTGLVALSGKPVVLRSLEDLVELVLTTAPPWSCRCAWDAHQTAAHVRLVAGGAHRGEGLT